MRYLGRGTFFFCRLCEALLTVSPLQLSLEQSCQPSTRCTTDLHTLHPVFLAVLLALLPAWLLELLVTPVCGRFQVELLFCQILQFHHHLKFVSTHLMYYRANAQQPKLFVGMILILIFAEALALYGLIGESNRDL